MVTSTFNLEEKRLKREVKKRSAKLVLIQLPEGLKPHGPALASAVESVGALAIVSANPCYGACDLAIVEAERLGVDLIVHYGHTEMIKQSAFPALYIEAKGKGSIKSLVAKAVPFLSLWKRIGLAAAIQHVHKLGEVRYLLSKEGKTVAMGNTGRLKYAGQVTGCDYSNAKSVTKRVDAFLFVGGGKFHATGLELATGKPTIVADPYERKVFSLEGEASRTLRKRWANILESKQAKSIGVLIGLKSGQKRLDQALETKKKVENYGKKATLFALREITAEALTQFPTVDAFINTACPRLSLDDTFQTPLLTPAELRVALGELEWRELCRKGWFEN